MTVTMPLYPNSSLLPSGANARYSMTGSPVVRGSIIGPGSAGCARASARLISTLEESPGFWPSNRTLSVRVVGVSETVATATRCPSGVGSSAVMPWPASAGSSSLVQVPV